MTTETPKATASTARIAAVVVVLVAAMGIGAGLYVFRSLRRLPAETLEQGRTLVDGAARIARAFRQGTVTTRFLAEATELHGAARFQFATLRQTEIFERTDRVAVLWGRLELPEVVVEARAPVEYTYYVSFDEPWQMSLENGTIRVLAPPIRANAPAVDVSALEYEVRAGSLLRNEERVVERLRASLTALAAERARRNAELVREIGRREIEKFVRNWLAGRFGDVDDVRIEVVFADEPARETEPAPRPPLPPGAAVRLDLSGSRPS